MKNIKNLFLTLSILTTPNYILPGTIFSDTNQNKDDTRKQSQQNSTEDSIESNTHDIQENSTNDNSSNIENNHEKKELSSDEIEEKEFVEQKKRILKELDYAIKNDRDEYFNRIIKEDLDKNIKKKYSETILVVALNFQSFFEKEINSSPEYFLELIKRIILFIKNNYNKEIVSKYLNMHSDFKKWASFSKDYYLNTGDTCLTAIVKKFYYYGTKIYPIIILLIKSGADINFKKSLSGTALIITCEKDHDDLTKLLIKFGAKINLKDASGNTAFIIATQFANLNIIKLLIESGADINQKNLKYETAFDCFKKRKEEIKNWNASYLNNKYKETESFLTNIKINSIKPKLFKTIQSGNFKKTKKLIIKNPLKIYDQNGNNPLHWSIIKEKENSKYNRIIDLILSIKPELANEKNDKGLTPIELMFEKGKFSWIRYLLKKETKQD